MATPEGDAGAFPQAGLARSARTRTPLSLAVLRFGRQPAGVFGCSVLLAVVLLAMLAPVVAPYSAIEQFPGNELVPPSARFPLGTDHLGRDVLSRIIFGTRVSLLVGVMAVALGASIGGGSGLATGYAQGRLDAVLMRLWDAVFAVPAILVGIALAAAFGSSSTVVAVTLGIATGPTFARLARAAVIAERHREYVHAAQTLGATHARIVRLHILPNIAGLLLVQVALTMAAAVLLEAGLSFLGLGAQPPEPSWGGMLSEGRQYLRQAPWYGVFPGIALTVLVLGLNFWLTPYATHSTRERPDSSSILYLRSSAPRQSARPRGAAHPCTWRETHRL